MYYYFGINENFHEGFAKPLLLAHLILTQILYLKFNTSSSKLKLFIFFISVITIFSTSTICI